MGIIVTILLSILGPIFRVMLPYLLAFSAGWYMCNQYHSKNNEQGKSSTITETVSKVSSGADLVVSAGVFGRRTKTVSLWGIEIPPEANDNATTSLRSIINEGDTVNIELKTGRSIGSNGVSGVVLHSGTNCNLEQLRRGWATASVVDKAFVAAQKEAETARVGIWKTKEPKKPKPFPWWKDELKEESTDGY